MNKKTKSNNKYVFSLKNVNIEKVDNMYKLSSPHTDNELSNIPVDNITKISDLNKADNDTLKISFLDEIKNPHNCTISMIDFTKSIDILNLKYNCYWCRHPFETIPIGCPINFVPSEATKNYYSHISKDTYTIKEDISSTRRKTIKEPRISINLKEYYETDGIFCSFNCCKAYIKDNSHNPLYNHSINLLLKLFIDIFGTRNTDIQIAPHWRLLKEYGGHLSIDEFRNSFLTKEFEEHGIVNNYKSLGFLYQEKIKF